MASNMIYTIHEGDAITENMIKDAAALFSNNYGVWGPLAESKVGSFANQGRRIRMSPARLKAELVPPSSARNFYVQVRDGDELIGNVFATGWRDQHHELCWITQLCVSSKRRNEGIATQLLFELRSIEENAMYGILSSHPFAIRALLRTFGRERTEESMIKTLRKHAKSIMSTCPVNYVRNAHLHDPTFDPTATPSNPSSYTADTGFFVDHAEPSEALEVLKNKGRWILGELPEGHEFMVIV